MKVILSIVAVCLSLGVGVYVTGCGSDSGTDGGGGGDGGGCDPQLEPGCVGVACVNGKWVCGADGGSGGDGGNNGECASASAAGAACTGGVCLENTGSTFDCYAACDVVGNICNNTDGSAGSCYFWGTKTGDYICMTPGETAVGDACVTIGDCGLKAQCLEEGGIKACYATCTAEADCTSPDTCTDTTFGFSVCVSP